jgi:hypothetical protein
MQEYELPTKIILGNSEGKRTKPYGRSGSYR